jgi:hypothetical protein
MKTPIVFLSAFAGRKLFTLLLICPLHQFAQEQTPNTVVWAEIGLQTDLRARTGFNTALHFNLLRVPFELAYYKNEEFLAGWPFKPYRLNYIREIRNISLMSGFHFYSRYFSFLPMGGLSIGEGVWRTDNVETIIGGGFFSTNQKVYEYEQFRYLGAIVNFKGLITPSNWIGIDLNVFVNVHRHIDYGLSVGLVFGSLRKYKA